MSVINTNITSMIAQQNLNKSNDSLSTAMERLSSGLRINSAADDAAGQAIANRMSAQITGLNQAVRNSNDGISVAQTAEGALNQINDNVQRVRELTVQAENGTNSQDDLNSIQDEINQRLTEIDRISAETDFNGTKVLDEGVSAMSIQVGANDDETIEISLTAINRDTLDLTGFNVNGPDNPSAPADGEKLTDVDGKSFTAATTASTTAGDTEIAIADFTGVAAANVSDVDGYTGGGDVVSDADGNLFLDTGTTDANGDTIYYEVESFDATASTGGAGATLDSVTITGDALTIATSDPLKQLDDSLSTIDGLRSELGAVQNRFDSAITNLETNSTNLSAARSRIEDADYAKEVANMTRAQILQQAGTSVLAQANQIPQSVLSLLG
ncbi:FliC/FljB family flagellin [Halomonas vilamensis]|uniref:Flagellin n=1 Tax=Vreelandella vilamensis TaxID=531309 RepID=A0ABU1H716_9GAMM|nr:FliC/FljB family flagellin [Halomonas vilamensis]MDR5899472.1 FliC/FljB family flagellin [Halomonas vilamensis]